MTNKFKFFHAIYGKTGRKGPIPEGYKWFYIDEGFSKEALKKADECAHSFQWLSSTDITQYNQVKCWIPNIDNTKDGLFLRFLDVGEDDRKRPHTLRIEAYYFLSDFLNIDPDIPLALLIDSEFLQDENIVFNHSEWNIENKGKIQSLQNAIQNEDVNIYSTTILLTKEPICFRFRVPYSFLLLSSDTFRPLDINATSKKTPSIQKASAISKKNEIPSHTNHPCKIKNNISKKLYKLYLLCFALLIISSYSIYNNITKKQIIKKLNGTIVNLNNDLKQNIIELDLLNDQITNAKNILFQELGNKISKNFQEQTVDILLEKVINEKKSIQRKLSIKNKMIDKLAANKEETTKKILKDFDTLILALDQVLSSKIDDFPKLLDNLDIKEAKKIINAYNK